MRGNQSGGALFFQGPVFGVTKGNHKEREKTPFRVNLAQNCFYQFPCSFGAAAQHCTNMASVFLLWYRPQTGMASPRNNQGNPWVVWRSGSGFEPAFVEGTVPGKTCQKSFLQATNSRAETSTKATEPKTQSEALKDLAKKSAVAGGDCESFQSRRGTKKRGLEGRLTGTLCFILLGVVLKI